MQFSTLALSALLGLASAQVQVTVVEVSSANNSLTFSPNNIKVAAGGMVQFQFLAGNHTVTQSTFDQPCMPINMVNNSIPGFHSGFVPVSASNGQIPTYTIMVNNTTPIWVYCAQGKHCENGMSMVINENTAANASRSLANYQSAAVKATTVIPSGGSSGTSGSTSTTGTAGTGSANTSGATLRSASGFAAAVVAVAGSFFLL